MRLTAKKCKGTKLLIFRVLCVPSRLNLDEIHFSTAYKPVCALNQLAQQIFEKIRIEPWANGDLRKEMIHEVGCSKSQFDTALKNLQISLNVVRDSAAEQDTWLTFQEVYTDIWNRPVPEVD